MSWNVLFWPTVYQQRSLRGISTLRPLKIEPMVPLQCRQGLESYRGWGRAGWIRMMPSSNGIRSMQWRRRRTGGFLDVPSLITLKHPTLFIFSMLKAPKREKTGEGSRGSKNLPGMIATVLRARKTRKVRSAARLPRSIPIVMYLQSTKVHKLEWNSSSKNQFSFRMQKTTG